MIFTKINIKVNFKILFLIGVLGNVLFILGIYLGFSLIPAIINEKVWKSKILKENTEQWQMFLKTPFPFDFKVYIFNIENADDILLGAKPKVKEVGPYIYKLYRWKENVAYDYLKDEISFYEYEKYEFDQNATSILDDGDMVTVLNVPYNSFLYSVERIAPGFLSMVDPHLTGVFGEYNSLFLKTKVKDFLFDGVRFCENEGEGNGPIVKTICNQIKNTVKKQKAKQMRIEENGILYANFHFKNNTHQGYVTIKSGHQNRNDVAKLVSLENRTYQSVWLKKTSHCNKIGGVTTIFPPNIDENMSFYSFSEDICRSIKLTYKGVETIQGIKGYKFGASTTSFNNSINENDCFCVNQTKNLDDHFGCLYDGILDLTTCKVLWKNGSKNVVYSNELKTVNCEEIKVGCGVKMLYKKRWYYGKVLAIESNEYDEDEKSSSHSEDDIPTAKLQNPKNNAKPISKNSVSEKITSRISRFL